ncbi:MAG: helix-turn-helix domain-containing protein [Bacteroides sp.]
MYILGKRADLLDEADIRRLVENRVQESKSLDYKKELKIGQDKDKKEFLYDVSAMYNTEGGCLVFGIEESKDEKGYNTGTPAAICGINIDNSDKLTQQIEDIIKGNSEPRISNIILNIIEMEGIFILVIGIPKGLGFPSMITFNESNKFYRRRNSGKYAVDVYELNQMFMQNQILKEYAEKFRSERIEKVRNLKVFPMLDNTASFFIQIIPFSFINERTLDFTQIESMNLTTTMRPMGASGWDKMFNLDGFATFSTSYDRQKITSYDQILRNGIYEVYTSSVFEQIKDDKGIEVNCIYGQYLISNTIEKIQNGLAVLQKFQIEPPFLICLSIHNIYNGTIKGDRLFRRRFMTNEIILPQIILPTYETNIYTELKSNFDILWQSIGYSSSPRE